MSKLGNLFGGGGDADNNDALKYSAPKEPKKAMQSPAPAGTAGLSAAPAATVAPKMMASATVRLYKVNSATGAYEVQAGGGPLGCVIFGTGLQNQILVYNAQRAPQATVSINADFIYNIRDTYMSFADSIKNNWSLLFDTEEMMHKFLRALVATIAHAACFSEPPVQKVITGSLPGVASTSAAEIEDSTILAVGYLAGIQYSAWELCQDVGDSPAEAIAGAPFKAVALPDLVKVKVAVDGGSVEEPLGGLSASLLGRKKGDRYMLAIPPVILQKGTVDMRLRQRPRAWMVVEVEIMKVKDGSKEKKEKKEKPVSVITSEATSSEPDQHQPFVGDGSNEHASKTGSNSLKDRMAHLSHASGGMQMGIPLQQPQQQHKAAQQMEPAHEQQQSQQNHNYINNQQYAPYQQQPPVQPQYQHQQYGGFQQQPQPQSAQLQYGQQQLQPGYENPYAVALVPGQEARSHFMGDVSQSSMQGRYPVERSHMGGDSPANPMLQQSVNSIRASVMQMNQKLDALLSMSGGGMGMNQHMVMQQMGEWGMSNGQAGFYKQGVGSMKGRGEEVIAMISAMVEEFDKKANNSGEDNALKEQVNKLQDKLETLQNRNEKLMLEKSDLLDRQSNMLQTSAASSAKTYDLQREVETLRREKDHSESKLADLLRSVETLQQAAQSGGQDRSRLNELEEELARTRNEKRSLELTVFQLREKTSSEDEKWTQRVSDERRRADIALNDLSTAHNKLSALTQEIDDLRHRCQRAESNASASLSGISEEVMNQKIEAAVNEAEQRMKIANEAARADEVVAANRVNRELKDKVASLNETVGNLTDELIKASSANPVAATVSPDQLKELVQIIYGKLHERLVPEDADDVSYTPVEVMKHVKAVMKAAVSEHSAAS